MKRRAAQNVSLPIGVRKKLKDEALRRDVSVSFVVRRALEAYLGSDEAREPLGESQNESK